MALPSTGVSEILFRYNNHIVRLLVLLSCKAYTAVVATPRYPVSSGSPASIDHVSFRPDTGRIPTIFESRKPGAWLPEDYRGHHELLRRVATHVDQHPPQALAPVMQEFKTFTETNSRVYMYFTQMFHEIPWRWPYGNDIMGNPQIRDYKHLLLVLNHIVTTAPDVDSAGVPMIAILAYPMGTSSGYAAFLDPDVNRMLKKVLNEWGRYLKTSASRYVLGTDKHGWLGEPALKALEHAANAPYKVSKKFEEIYMCDPSAKYYGFKSWDDFFTRKFRTDARPLAHPGDDNVIANACEARDQFFAKGQPYSILDILGHDRLAGHFAGGTVYQAFLSPLAYHRWHAPVSGTVRRAFVVDGTYFSMPLFQGLGDRNTTEINPIGMGQSQAYLSALATRAVIIIQADNPAIGLVAFTAIGMDEVSSCEITVREGQHIKKGQEMGMFHFGGSSYCLLFREEVELDEFPVVGNISAPNVPLRSKLAEVKNTRQRGSHPKR